MVAGIVCEYNPFHNGHLYHIEKTKKAGADYIICVMSGNFVQRGDCAVIDKWQRAQMAIKAGADLVIDLPVPWAIGSAESFARGSISLLASLGIDMLSFGCENDNSFLLGYSAKVLSDEKLAAEVKNFMKKGMSYPAALTFLAEKFYGKSVSEIISSPNNTLAVEYIRQLKISSPDCKILPILREGASHDGNIKSEQFASASTVRELLKNDDYSVYVPCFVKENLDSAIKDSQLHFLKYTERAILSSLREMKKEAYALYVTDETGLADRIYNAVQNCTSLETLYFQAKSKNYTHARIRREVLNLYLKIPVQYGKSTPPYIRPLAANERGASLLKNATLPVVTKHSQVPKDEFSEKIYEIQCLSTDKYALMSEVPLPCGLEQKKSISIICYE